MSKSIGSKLEDCEDEDNSDMWPRERTMKLINLIKTHECMWNSENKNYRNKFVRDNAIQDMADMLNLTQFDIRQKIHRLRSQYTNERRKMERKNYSSGDEFVTKWKYYKALQFMYEQNSNENEKTALQDNENIRKDEDGDDCSDPFSECSIDLIKTEPPPSPVSQETYEMSKKRKLNKEDEQIVTKSQPKQTVPEPIRFNRRRDEYNIFGDYVASELRMLHNESDIQFNLKNKIQRAVLDANLKYSKRKFGGKSSRKKSPIPVYIVSPVPEDTELSRSSNEF